MICLFILTTFGFVVLNLRPDRDTDVNESNSFPLNAFTSVYVFSAVYYVYMCTYRSMHTVCKLLETVNRKTIRVLFMDVNSNILVLI